MLEPTFARSDRPTDEELTVVTGESLKFPLTLNRCQLHLALCEAGYHSMKRD